MALYSVHPGVTMVQKWIATMKEKTGRTFEQWLALIVKEGPPTEKERRAWLKEKFGLGTNTAWWLAGRAGGGDGGIGEENPEIYLQNAAKYVEDMYAGGKARLRPIHDAILAEARGLGADVRICPCKTIVPLYRQHVFAEIKPSARTRLDLGLALGKYARKLPRRLIDTGGAKKKERITHRLALTSVQEFDEEARKWLRTAYELEGTK